MNKEQFVKIGLTEADAEKAAQASADELEGFIPKTRFDEVNEAKKKLKADIAERDKQLEELKKSGAEGENLKAEIEKLQTENKAKDEQHQAEVKALKIENALSAALTSASAKTPAAVKAMLNLTNAELQEDGTVKGLSEQLEKLVKDESTAYLFAKAETKPPAFKGVKPGEASDGVAKPSSMMSYEEMAAIMEQNPNADI